MNTNALIDRLMQTVSLFRGFSRMDVQEFLSRARRVDCVGGETVIRERDAGHSLYVVISGELEVLRSASGTHDVRIALLGPGDTFGEMALLDNRPRSATVRCRNACCLLMLEEKDLLHIPDVCPKLYRNLACLIAERLRGSNASISLMLSDTPSDLDSPPPHGRSVRRIG